MNLLIFYKLLKKLRLIYEYKNKSARRGAQFVPIGSDVTPYVLGNTSISYQHNAYYQSIKNIDIYGVLRNRESDNMCLVPYNVDPE